jgi:hypothetical protein
VVKCPANHVEQYTPKRLVTAAGASRPQVRAIA